MWFSWSETVHEMNGQWQYLRRSCLIIMVLSEVSNFRLGKQMRQSKSNFGKTSTQNCFASWKASLSRFPNEGAWFKMILSSWGSQLKMPEVKKGHWKGVLEIYDGELVLNFKHCLSNIVIIFNWLVLIKVWQTRSLSQLITPLLWDNYHVLTNSLSYLKKKS